MISSPIIIFSVATPATHRSGYHITHYVMFVESRIAGVEIWGKMGFGSRLLTALLIS